MLLTLMAVSLAACGGEDTALTTTPDDPDAVILTVTSEGGFVPVEFNLDRMPRHVLTVDRSLYFQGPTTEEFPGPILPNVQVTTIDEATYSEVMDLVDDLGLANIDERLDDTGSDRIADASTEVITLYDDDGAHRYGFYALGLAEDGSTDRLLAGEIVELLDEAANTGESSAYQPQRLQVAAGPPMEVEEAMRTVEEWPLEVSYQEMDEWGMGWRCAVVTDDEVVPSLVEIFSSATQATVWETGEEEFAIRARPLLPGETGCDNAPPTP